MRLDRDGRAQFADGIIVVCVPRPHHRHLDATERESMKYRHSGKLVLAQLINGPASTDELIRRIYAIDDASSPEAVLSARRTLWVAVHRLRKQGYAIIQEGVGGKRGYRLQGHQPCPRCNGTGRVEVEHEYSE